MVFKPGNNIKFQDSGAVLFFFFMQLLKKFHKPFIATAMHDGVDSPVDQSVFGLEAGYPEGTRGVVPATATIRFGKAAQLGVFPR